MPPETHKQIREQKCHQVLASVIRVREFYEDTRVQRKSVYFDYGKRQRAASRALCLSRRDSR